MLATRGERVPTDPGWIHEVKWDGMRVLVEVAGGVVRAHSRNENDVTVSFPELAALAGLAASGNGLLLDGELVALVDGVPSFGGLAERMHVRDARRAAELMAGNPVTLVVFDLLRNAGTSLLDQPLAERRAAL